ncbi:MAG: hypothetical protein M1834_005753 [Cirrosporium novae-zelandiae]|nr:MAG: hypothetical protein M1834_005753 [Cirrosporium novae-zelandiae]
MDRDRDRDRDRRYDDRGSFRPRPLGGGESYRPGGHSGDTFRRRSPPPRTRSPLGADTYVPNRPRSRSPAGYRRRSRSPLGRDTYRRDRGGGDLISRRYSPIRDDRARSPPRYGRRSRSPPPNVYNKREREASVSYRARESRDFRDARSPPPKRERLASPPRRRYDAPPSPSRNRRPYSPPHVRDYDAKSNYHPRSRSPPRRRDPYGDDNWRRRSASPKPVSRAEPASGRDSLAGSRRSSPPAHPERLIVPHVGSDTHSPAYGSTPYGSRSAPRSPAPAWRDRSPPRRAREASPPRANYPPSPANHTTKDSHYDIPFRDRERERERDRYRDDVRTRTPNEMEDRERAPPSGPSSSYRNGIYDSPRAPPTGPSAASRSYNQSTAMSPPAGPGTPAVPISAHNRPASVSLASAPTRPRGEGGYGPRGGFHGGPPRRGAFHGSYRSASYDRPPSGPRGSTNGFGGPPPSFRSNNTSTTYPRTQRFNTGPNHLSGLSVAIPGGKALPSLVPQNEKRIAQLEAEAEKIRAAIEEKQKGLRQGMKEWDQLERESARDALRSQLAEEHLERLTSDGGMGPTTF